MEYFQIDTAPGNRDEIAYVSDFPSSLSDCFGQYYHGKSMRDSWPKDATLKLNGEYAGRQLMGLIPNLRSLLLATKDVASVLTESGANIEALPFTLLDHRGRVRSKDYLIVNPMDFHDCLDLEKSKVLYSDDPEKRILAVGNAADLKIQIFLSAKKLEKAPAIFRAKYENTRIFATRPILEKIKAVCGRVFIYRIPII